MVPGRRGENKRKGQASRFDKVCAPQPIISLRVENSQVGQTPASPRGKDCERVPRPLPLLALGRGFLGRFVVARRWGGGGGVDWSHQGVGGGGVFWHQREGFRSAGKQITQRHQIQNRWSI